MPLAHKQVLRIGCDSKWLFLKPEIAAVHGHSLIQKQIKDYGAYLAVTFGKA
jgi:hypothetical protein